jgi:hypothetical protein
VELEVQDVIMPSPWPIGNLMRGFQVGKFPLEEKTFHTEHSKVFSFLFHGTFPQASFAM